MSKLSINLQNLADNTVFTDGDHAITVKAKADGYQDSAASTAAIVTAFTVDTYGTADDPSSTTKVASYKFVAEKGITFAALIDGGGGVGSDFKLTYTGDEQKTVYLTDSSGSYSLAIPASDTIEGKSYSAQWPTTITQLATPTDVAITAATLTFTPVEHATSYEVYADGESIGVFTSPDARSTTISIVDETHDEQSGYSWSALTNSPDITVKVSNAGVVMTDGKTSEKYDVAEYEPSEVFYGVRVDGKKAVVTEYTDDYTFTVSGSTEDVAKTIDALYYTNNITSLVDTWAFNYKLTPLEKGIGGAVVLSKSAYVSGTFNFYNGTDVETCNLVSIVVGDDIVALYSDTGTSVIYYDFTDDTWYAMSNGQATAIPAEYLSKCRTFTVTEAIDVPAFETFMPWLLANAIGEKLG